jgi:hypothetical protein
MKNNFVKILALVLIVIPITFSLYKNYSKKNNQSLLFSNGTYLGQVLNGEPHGKGTFTYKDGSVCEGKFKNGRTYQCIFTPAINSKKNRKMFQKFSGALPYEVTYYTWSMGKCKIDKKKKKHIMYLKKSFYSSYTRTVDKNEVYFCFDYLEKKKTKIRYFIAFSVIAVLFLFYLIVISRRNNAIHNYNLKHKTKFKEYDEYKKQIDKTKFKELKQNKKRRTKIERNSNINESDLMDKVKRLKSLYKNGTLNKAEFEKAKNKLLK